MIADRSGRESGRERERKKEKQRQRKKNRDRERETKTGHRHQEDPMILIYGNAKNNTCAMAGLEARLPTPTLETFETYRTGDITFL